MKNTCLNQIENCNNYRLEKDGLSYNISDFDSGTIILPAKGKYKLFATEIEEEHYIVIDNIINSDTLELPKIVEKILWPPISYKKNINKELEKKYRQKNLPTFWICDKLCNGKYETFYSNGVMKFSGKFENGIAIGEFKRYYQNGKIKEVSLFDDDGFLKGRTLFKQNGAVMEE